MKISDVLLSYIFNFVLVICITLMAIHFDNPGLLWWYLLPATCAIFT